MYDSVLPLAEWVVASWSHLLRATSQSPEMDGKFGKRWHWRRTHAFAHVGSGAALPDAELWRASSTTLVLRWRETGLGPGQRLGFLGSGEELLDLPATEAELTDFVEGVLARLAEHPSAEQSWRATELREAWRARRNAEPWDRAELLAALQGEVWSDLSCERRSELTAASASGEWMRAWVEALPGMELSELRGKADMLAAACEKTGEPRTDWIDLRHALRSRPRPLFREPWKVGWDRAGLLRSILATDHLDPVGLLAQTGVAEMNGTILGHAQSAVGWRAGRGPVRAMRAASGPAARFSAARDLYPLLFAGASTRDSAFVLPSSPRGFAGEARAFAAELVAPWQKVAQAMARADLESDVWPTQIAKDLGAPLQCILHQIGNHNLLD